MFTDKHILDVCKSLGVDPNKQGEVPKEFGTYINFKEVDPLVLFPGETGEQIKKIGEILYNLCCQRNVTRSYNFSIKKCTPVERAILCTEFSQNFWFQKGIVENDISNEDNYKILMGRICFFTGSNNSNCTREQTC